MLIYALTDPRTGQVRYVGKTRNLAKRLLGHMDEALRDDTHKARWIRALKRLGLKPGHLILEVVNGDADEAERAWIKKFPKRQLTNATEGGDGGMLSADARARCVEGIRKAAAEGRMSNRKGVPHTEETKRKMRAAKLRQMERGTAIVQNKSHQSKASKARWSDPDRREAGREATRRQWAAKRDQMLIAQQGARHLT